MKIFPIKLLLFFSTLLLSSMHLLALTDENLTEPKIADRVVKLLLKNAPEYIHFILDCLKDPQIYKARSPRKILLYGEPGTGKTDLAIAIAQETERECIIIQGPFLANQYKNSGTERLKEIFSEIADSDKPIVLVIDELHTITEDQSANNPDKNMAAGFWLALDECQKNNNIFIIAITNYEDRMPEQLKNRFGMSRVKITSNISLEDKSEIIETYMQLSQCAYDCDSKCKKEIAEEINAARPRQIEELVHLAALRSLQRNPHDPRINREDFAQPIDKFKSYQTEHTKDEIKKNDWSWSGVLSNARDVAYIASSAITVGCFLGKVTGKWSCPETFNSPPKSPNEPKVPTEN